jgi:hypothetical protein
MEVSGMEHAKFEEIFKLLESQKQALTALAVELVTAPPLIAKAQLCAQEAIIFRSKIEERVRELRGGI